MCQSLMHLLGKKKKPRHFLHIHFPGKSVPWNYVRCCRQSWHECKQPFQKSKKWMCFHVCRLHEQDKWYLAPNVFHSALGESHLVRRGFHMSHCASSIKRQEKQHSGWIFNRGVTETYTEVERSHGRRNSSFWTIVGVPGVQVSSYLPLQ